MGCRMVAMVKSSKILLVPVCVLDCLCFACFLGFLAGEVEVVSLSSVCEVIADGLLELAEGAALMSDDCIKAVIKHSTATPYWD